MAASLSPRQRECPSLAGQKPVLAIVNKGQDKKYDSYSGFQDDGGARTEMDQLLKKIGTKESSFMYRYGLLREGYSH